MSDSKIEWTEKTWNPVTGCNKVSAGCKHCYAEVMHKRLMVLKPEKYAHPFLDGAFPYEPDLLLPLKWKKPAMVFVNSMSDLFHESVPMEFICRVFAVMAKTPHHTYQILTKRPWRMMKVLTHINFREQLSWEILDLPKASTMATYDPREDYGWPLRNVWLGVSVEDQITADMRIPQLLDVPAAVRFLSCEPLLGDIKLYGQWGSSLFNHFGIGSKTEINWVIAGGESGHGARPMHPDWVRGLRDQCVDAGVPFFFKQWGEWADFAQGITGIKKAAMVCNDGLIITGKNLIPSGKAACLMSKVGKKKAGRQLDGMEYSEMPGKVGSGELRVESELGMISEETLLKVKNLSERDII